MTTSDQTNRTPGRNPAASLLRNSLLLVCCCLAGAQMGHARAPSEDASATMQAGVEIRRTADGIPHIRAGNWRQLGIGVGYAQAEDALCTLAEAFVTYEGQRSWFFGPEAKPARDSTFGRARNLDLDFFFRAFADGEVVAQYRAQQPEGLNQLMEGYAEGYNRHLAELRGRPATTDRPCVGAPWVRPITVTDIYRRLFSAQVAAGYAHFIPEIVNAEPPRRPDANARPAGGLEGQNLRARLVHRLGQQEALGSNMMAFGERATGEKGGLLFGNPHWYWGGPDRFYQMHLTIPGKVNVAGVAFLGVPVVMIGFNEQVAWSHTVSEARRFGFFDVKLDPADPTRVEVDGKSEPMQARQVSVTIKAAGGEPGVQVRTLYRTRFGPVVDLREHDPAFGWGGVGHAVAMRDVNEQNFRIFTNYFYWNQAKSLDDFVAIQRREAAVPWVNTTAIGRGDGRAWFADVGAAPNAPDALREACATPLTKGFGQIDPFTPFLDGSRSGCDWRRDAAAVQAGAMLPAAMPSVMREDYVANMNDSYWLTNAKAPLEGFPAVLGGERQPLSLRGRLGHRMAADLLRDPSPSAEALGRRVMQAVLVPRAYSAERFKDELLTQACKTPTVRWRVPPSEADAAKVPAATRDIDVTKACAVLKRWSGRADPQDRGAVLWEAFWNQLEKAGGVGLYQQAFSADQPLDTPRQPGSEDGELQRQALAAAVVSLDQQALDQPVGHLRFARAAGRRWPMGGGCPQAGYFVVICNLDGSQPLGPDSLANSYLQVVHFGAQGVVAHTFLAHGQDESALVNGRGAGPVIRYARKEWLRFPFAERDIAADAALRRTVLRP